MSRRWIFRGALVVSAAGLVACGGGDDTSSIVASQDGGGDGTVPVHDAGVLADASADALHDAGALADAGGDGTAPLHDAGGLADASGDGTVPHQEAGGPADAGVDGTNSPIADASADADAKNDDGGAADATADGADGGADAADASDGGGPGYAIFVGTDFAQAELSVVALNQDAVAGNLALSDEDSVAYASGGVGFVLERSIGDVVSLSPAQPWTARATIDVNDTPDAGSYAANPRAIVVTAGTKAYVARYTSNVAKVVDIASGATSGSIDLSAFVAPDDPDGLVDVTDGTYDPVSKRAYLLLQRINQSDFGTGPDYVGACLASHAEIVAVDTTTDAIVPLSDAAANGAIDLLGDNPGALTPDFAHGRILVAEGGCYQVPDGGGDAGPAARLGRGVESVSLSTATPAWLYQTSDVDLLSALVLVDSTHAYVELGGAWFPWDPTQPTLGTTAIGNFPQAPFYDGNGRIVGLSAEPTEAGSGGVTWSVVALSVATGEVSTLVTSPFKNVVPATSYGVTSAFLGSP
jgi:hypothetical protein